MQIISICKKQIVYSKLYNNNHNYNSHSNKTSLILKSSLIHIISLYSYSDLLNHTMPSSGFIQFLPSLPNFRSVRLLSIEFDFRFLLFYFLFFYRLRSDICLLNVIDFVALTLVQPSVTITNRHSNNNSNSSNSNKHTYNMSNCPISISYCTKFTFIFGHY